MTLHAKQSLPSQLVTHWPTSRRTPSNIAGHSVVALGACGVMLDFRLYAGIRAPLSLDDQWSRRDDHGRGARLSLDVASREMSCSLYASFRNQRHEKDKAYDL